MSHNSMASVSSSSATAPSPVFSYDDDKLDLESVRGVVAAINQHITALLADTKSWKCLKLKCSSKLDVCNREYLEFLEQSILSNLYWGIESIEAALQAKWSQERTSRLSVVRKLQGDEWQVATHFLQALVVSPRLLHTEIATDLMMVKMARRYKAWLMYYQIMSSGEGSLSNGEASSTTSTHHELQQIMSKKFRSTSSSNLCEHGNMQCTCSNFEKVHPFKAQNDAKDEEEKIIITANESIGQNQGAITELRSGLAEIPKNSTTKCLKDILLDSESETPIYLDSSDSSSCCPCYPFKLTISSSF